MTWRDGTARPAGAGWACVLALIPCLVACAHDVKPRTLHDVYVLRSKAGVQGKNAEAWEVRGATTRSRIITPAKGQRLRHLRMEPLAWGDRSLPVRDMEMLFSHGGKPGKLEVRGAEAIVSANRRALRVTGVVTFGTVSLPWRRVITEGDVPGTVSMRTELDVPPALSDVDLVERTYWKSAPFVPGEGLIETDGPFPSSWIGAESTTDGFVLATAGFRPSITAAYDVHGPHRFMHYTDLRARGHRVKDRVLWWTRAVVIADTFAEAVRRAAWSAGTPYPEARVVLSHEPPSAALRVSYPDGRPWLWTRTNPGHPTVVPLPRGREAFDITATAFGHAASQATGVVPDKTKRVAIDVPSSGQLSLHITDAATGAPIPGRVRVVPISPPTKFSLGPDYRADGAEDAAYTLSGELSLTLPLGKHRILVSHGPDWTWADQTVVITGDEPTSVDAKLTHLSRPGGWAACDFHLHSIPSPDSEVTLEDRVTALAAEGIDFAVPTDHDTVTDLRPAIEATHANLDTVSGAEVTTAAPIFGHFNAFPLARDPNLPNGGAPDPVARSPQELFDQLHANTPNTLVQVNHPRLEGGIGYFDVMGVHDHGQATDPRYSGNFDLLEVWNGFDLARAANTDRNFVEWLGLLAHGHHYVATGNSDSHTLRTQWSGYPRTYVNIGEHDLEESDAGRAPPLLPLTEEEHRVVRALRAGRVMVSNGPFLMATVDGNGPGAHIEVDGARVELVIDVQVPPWASVDTLEVFRGEEKFATIALKPNEVRKAHILRRVRVAIEQSTFLVVTARGTTPMTDYFGKQNIFPFAFTNPIWIERK